MIYCMADLHGERNFFLRMLEQIRFSDTDHLYILGDVIDRGTGGVDMLEQIAENRKCIQKGGQLDYQKAANILLEEFRNGKIGKVTLENIQSQEQ